VEEDPSGGKLAAMMNSLNGAPHKLKALANFHVGDTVTALQRASLQPGGQEVILYATAMGSIGALYPFTSKEDIDFFVHLEMNLRQENQPLCGRDHMAFRSAYFPVKDVVDGDLCAQYPTVSL
jgi:splicing factor 3B subunit 3